MQEESPFDQLTKDVTRIRKVARLNKQQLGESIDSIIELLQETKSSITASASAENEEDQRPMKRLMQNNKNFYLYLQKFGHNIDKLFSNEINILFRHSSIPNPQIVFESIAEHLLMEKEFELYQIFIKDMGLDIGKDENKLSSLKTLQKILESLKNHSIEETLLWAEENKNLLADIDSSLLFSLHRLQFLLILASNNKDAIAYARKNFKQFFLGSKIHADQAQKVMGLILCDKALLQTETNWEIVLPRLQELVINAFSNIYNLSSQSALLHCLIAGTLALPKFIKYEKVAYPEEDDGYVYTGVQNEFPIEVEVGRDFEFHSVFVCPITREVISPDHHAALLPCGHVIAESSMKKITDNSNREKFKCPTCPKETVPKDTKIIYF